MRGSEKRPRLNSRGLFIFGELQEFLPGKSDAVIAAAVVAATTVAVALVSFLITTNEAITIALVISIPVKVRPLRIITLASARIAGPSVQAILKSLVPIGVAVAIIAVVAVAPATLCLLIAIVLMTMPIVTVTVSIAIITIPTAILIVTIVTISISPAFSLPIAVALFLILTVSVLCLRSCAAHDGYARYYSKCQNEAANFVS